MSTEIGARIREGTPAIRGTGATLHFTEAAPLPAGLIEEVVAARIRENEDLEAARRR